MLNGIQIIATFFGLVWSYFTFLAFKRSELTIREFIGWEILWIGFILVSIFPTEFELFSGSLGAIRPMDLYSVLGFIVVLSISFYTYVNLDRLRKKVEKTIRDLALDEVRKNKK